jgi:AcrR family transcriptional regulator
MTTSPSPRDTAPAASSRERILDAAEQLMAERGFTATSITAISEASKSPASSIYWHFESKEGLLAAVLERSARSWIAGLGRARDLPGDPSERLASFVTEGLLDIARRPPEFMRLAVMLGVERSVTHPDGDCMQAIRRIRTRGGALIAEAIEEAYGDAGAETASRIARACRGLAMAFIEGAFLAHQIDPSDTDLDRLARQLVTALRAVAAEHLAELGGEANAGEAR